MVSDYAHHPPAVGSFCRSIEKWINHPGVGDAGVVAISSERSLDRPWKGSLACNCLIAWGKRLVVNEHGRLLYPRALALLEQAVEIEQLFREDNGAIRIYASSTIGNYILPAVIARYRHDYPQLPIELSVGNSQDVMQAVLDFRVDIGFIEGPCHSTEIISEPWLEDELVVFAAPTSPLARGPVTLEQLAAAPWILRERGSGTREIVDYLLLSHLPKFEMAMELGNSEAIKHAVRHGLGISCLSRRVIEDQLQAGTLSEVAVPLPRLMRTLWRIHHRQKTPFQRATALSGLLRSRECTALSCCTRTCWCCVDFVTQRPQHAFARKEIGCFTYNPLGRS